jgi:hypothetical protein
MASAPPLLVFAPFCAASLPSAALPWVTPTTYTARLQLQAPVSLSVIPRHVHGQVRKEPRTEGNKAFGVSSPA